MQTIRIVCALAITPFLIAGPLLSQDVAADKDGNSRRDEQRLSFQTNAPWSPRTNVNADIAMIYGIDPALPANLASWRQHGYVVQVMTGVAWGAYQDYLDGRFDGHFHWDEAQKYQDGRLSLHGDMPQITPYISPNEAYGRFLSSRVKQALDAGASAIYLEEPEYYADTGWSESFKREWKAYYVENWQAPDSSPDAQYRASKLKYFLYRKTLGQVFDSVKRYDSQHGVTIPCYVATHSLINYAHWTIVSPESSLIGAGADGYIAQVWTGTARTPNVYEGRLKERTFETAFLEYGAMQNLVRTSGQRIWYLNDPVEDNPKHTWTDYRANWESTLTASLLNSEVWRFEVMPWPSRVFNDMHPAETAFAGRGPQRNAKNIGIPQSYATELQTVISALGDMKQAKVQWEYSGTKDVGVLVSDTMMFQRADPDPSDTNLGSFFGLALPLLKRGVPVEPVQIESATTPGFLTRYKLLLLTYEGQKPPTPQFHSALANWVRAGGALVVVDNDRDPYNAVREWWNTAPYSYKTPRQHLFGELGIPEDATGIYKVGKGVVVSARQSPAALTYKTNGATAIRALAHQAASAVNLQWKETNALVLRRGPYLIAAGLGGSIPNAKPYVLHGRFIDLFNPNLPILHQVAITPGRRFLLLDVDTMPAGTTPSVVAAACRVREEHASAGNFTFLADGIAGTEAVVRVRTQRSPIRVIVAGKPLQKSNYEMTGDSLRLQFPNSAQSIPVEIDFPQS
jgi:hypothetical protein